MKKLLSLLVTLFLLFSCSSNVAKSKSNVGEISLNIGGVSSRTILPNVAEITPAKYVLSFTGPNTFSDVELTANTGLIPNVPIGTWKIDVVAYDNIDLEIANKIAEGSKNNIIVTSGNKTDATIDLNLLQTTDVYGNVSLILDWSFDNSIIDGFEGWIRNIESGSYIDMDETDASKFTEVAGQLTYTDSLKSGFYIININLKKGTDIKVPYWDVIHVYDNVPSKKTVTLSAEDFTGLAKNPTSVTVSEYNNGIYDSINDKSGIKVSWDDNNNIETGYIIERKILPSGGWVEVGRVTAGTTEYIDTGAPQNKTIKYNVKAVSADGESTGKESGNVKWGKPVPGIPSGGVSGQTSSSNITHNSFDLTWTEATDETPGSGLLYKVVTSTVNEITSVKQIENDGKGAVAMDWSPMPVSMPVNIDSLSSNTKYYINVLVKDEAGNIVSYAEKAGLILEVTTLSAYGSIDVTINVVAVPDLSIVFQKGNGDGIADRDVFMRNSTITLRTSQVYDEYIWIIEGRDLSVNPSADFTITPKTPTVSEILTIGADSLDIGLRTINVVCKKDGKYYSKSISLIIGN